MHNSNNLIISLLSDNTIQDSFIRNIIATNEVYLDPNNKYLFNLVKSHIITNNQKFLFIDQFNEYQDIIIHSNNITEIENAMVNNILLVNTIFKSYPICNEHFLLKIEFLGYNIIDFIKNNAAGCYNAELDTTFKASDYKISEDLKVYFHQICDIDYSEPEFFDVPDNTELVDFKD